MKFRKKPVIIEAIENDNPCKPDIFEATYDLAE